jgi:hypothetical protein
MIEIRAGEQLDREFAVGTNRCDPELVFIMTSISSRAALSLVAALGLAIRLGVLRRPRKEATALLIIDAQVR